MESDRNVRARAAAASSDAEPQRQEPPQAWPTSQALYAEGLSQRAEVVATSQPTWAIDGRAMRESTLGTDASETLRARQAEVRRVLLRRGQAG